MLFYTWKDVERFCLKMQCKWEKYISFTEVYPDELIVYPCPGITPAQALDILSEYFPKNINKEDPSIRLYQKTESLKISFDTEPDHRSKIKMPLFRQVIYNDSAYPDQELPDLSCPVIAFHSYKGGVGRTLSLLAFAKAWTNIHKKNNQKLLIIDSDIEAPGLSWIQGESNITSFSYLDLLTLIQDDSESDRIIDIAAEAIGNLTIPIETDERTVSHIFLPTFRYEEQLFDLYASPDSVVIGRNKEYILAEILSGLAVKLGASMVLVDLRAGISEHSAPLLLDPRVKKYCVTSTSQQSVIGTAKLLEYLAKGLPISEESNLPVILLGMIRSELDEHEKNDIITQLTDPFYIEDNKTYFLDNIIIPLPFASELVHLTSLKQILNVLEERDMYKNIKENVELYFSDSSENTGMYTGTQRKEILKKIYTFSRFQMTAELDGAREILLTHPIKNICAKFYQQLPITVIQGAKGSGKTFLYRQMMSQKNWTCFCNHVTEKNRAENEGFFLPVLAPKNIPATTGLMESINQCIDSFCTNVPFSNVSKSLYIENSCKLEQAVKQETEWLYFWEKIFVSSVSDTLHSFDELSNKLREYDTKIVYLIDGLEEIFTHIAADASQQKAVQVLCQDIVNLLSVRYDNIGIVIFLRSDLAPNAITVNYEHFKQAHNFSELRWSSEEALRLAVWIVSHAVENFYTAQVPIEDTSNDVIEKHLNKLWGLKLGKDSSNEAYSSRWILAALSDFKGRLQARDMIRFLHYSAEAGLNTPKTSGDNRILLPTDIRTAVSACSKDKIHESKTEYAALKPILERLEKIPSEKKVLPLNLESEALTAAEERIMMQEGYLIKDDGKLYLPEIIRHALGFRYGKGARPRVLSLMLKH